MSSPDGLSVADQLPLKKNQGVITLDFPKSRLEKRVLFQIFLERINVIKHIERVRTV